MQSLILLQFDLSFLFLFTGCSLSNKRRCKGGCLSQSAASRLALKCCFLMFAF